MLLRAYSSFHFFGLSFVRSQISNYMHLWNLKSYTSGIHFISLFDPYLIRRIEIC